MKQQNKTGIKSDDNLRLADLLKVERADEITKQIETILASNISTSQKIEKIEELDEGKNYIEILASITEEDRDRTYLSARGIYTPADAEKNLSRAAQVNGFLSHSLNKCSKR